MTTTIIGLLAGAVAFVAGWGIRGILEDRKRDALDLTKSVSNKKDIK
jgi:hypothetical protein